MFGDEWLALFITVFRQVFHPVTVVIADAKVDLGRLKVSETSPRGERRLDDDVLARFLHGGQIDLGRLAGRAPAAPSISTKYSSTTERSNPALISSHSPSTRSCSRSMDNGQASAWPLTRKRASAFERSRAHSSLRKSGTETPVVVTDGALAASDHEAHEHHPPRPHGDAADRDQGDAAHRTRSKEGGRPQATPVTARVPTAAVSQRRGGRRCHQGSQRLVEVPE